MELQEANGYRVGERVTIDPDARAFNKKKKHNLRGEVRITAIEKTTNGVWFRLTDKKLNRGYFTTDQFHKFVPGTDIEEEKEESRGETKLPMWFIAGVEAPMREYHLDPIGHLVVQHIIDSINEPTKE